MELNDNCVRPKILLLKIDKTGQEYFNIKIGQTDPAILEF